MVSAQKKLEVIEETLQEGKTVYISTHYKSIEVTPKTFKRWGNTLFKVSGNSLYIARGKNFDCIDYCKFTFSD